MQSHVVAVVRIAVNRRGPGFVGVRKGRRKEWYAFFTVWSKDGTTDEALLYRSARPSNVDRVLRTSITLLDCLRLPFEASTTTSLLRT